MLVSRVPTHTCMDHPSIQPVWRVCHQVKLWNRHCFPFWLYLHVQWKYMYILTGLARHPGEIQTYRSGFLDHLSFHKYREGRSDQGKTFRCEICIRVIHFCACESNAITWYQASHIFCARMIVITKLKLLEVRPSLFRMDVRVVYLNCGYAGSQNGEQPTYIYIIFQITLCSSRLTGQRWCRSYIMKIDIFLTFYFNNGKAVPKYTQVCWHIQYDSPAE